MQAKSLQGNSEEQAAQEKLISESSVSISMVAPLICMPIFSFNLDNAREKVSGCIPSREATRVLS